MPGLDGKLAGEEGGANPGAVLQDLQQVTAFRVAEGDQSPVVDGQHVDAGQLGQQAVEAAVNRSDGELAEEFGGCGIVCSETLAASLLGQGAAEISFAAAPGSGEGV